MSKRNAALSRRPKHKFLSFVGQLPGIAVMQSVVFRERYGNQVPVFPAVCGICVSWKDMMHNLRLHHLAIAFGKLAHVSVTPEDLLAFLFPSGSIIIKHNLLSFTRSATQYESVSATTCITSHFQEVERAPGCQGCSANPKNAFLSWIVGGKGKRQDLNLHIMIMRSAGLELHFRKWRDIRLPPG